MDCKAVFDAIDELYDEYVGLWADVCNIESPTASKEGVDAVCNFLVEKAERLGWDIEINDQKLSGNAACFTMNPNADKAPVCLSSHMDTVHPIGSFGTPAVKIDSEKIYGPGVTDCKGGIVSAMLAMHALKKCGYTERPVKLILQSDEELSSLPSEKGTVKFMAEKAKGCVAFLNGEGSDEEFRKLVIERKGILRFVLTVSGKSAQSSRCFDGASAVLEAAYKIIELERFADSDGITSNCGIVNGGSTANSVPDHCEITVDFRFKNELQRKEVFKAVENAANNVHVEGTSCTWRVKSERVAMPLCDKNVELVEKIRHCYAEAGLSDAVAASANGGSDAADMTGYGIPAIDSIGVAGGRIHSTEEFAYLSSLKESAKRQAAVIMLID